VTVVVGAPFRVLVADPPWQHADRLGARGAAAFYPTLPTSAIAAFPLPPLTDDAYLFLWRLSSMLPDALSVVAAWGFTVKSEIVWEKLTAKGKPWFGLGRHVRAAHETALVCTRGAPRPLVRNIRSRFAAKVGRHSEKPEAFYDLVERFAAGPHCDLFARRVRRGWTCIGNEVPLLTNGVVGGVVKTVVNQGERA
jgi:N6-adenosine-specific RNA methylase IME4